MGNNITYSILFLVIFYFRDVSTRRLKRFSKFNAATMIILRFSISLINTVCKI